LFFVSAYENPEHDDVEILRGAKAPLSAIYVFDLQTGTQTRLTGFGRNCSASWSPDGSRLAVSFGDSQNSGIYVVSPDGQHGTHLTESATIDTRPVWSPDGRMIAYVAVAIGTDTQDAGVYVIGVNGAGKKRVTDQSAHEVSWSKNGRMLLLQSAGGIDLINLDGTRQIPLAAGLERPLDAVFTPDGQGVMFRSSEGGSWNLYLVDLNGENRRKITGQLSASLFCLSPLLSRP